MTRCGTRPASDLRTPPPSRRASPPRTSSLMPPWDSRAAVRPRSYPWRCQAPPTSTRARNWAFRSTPPCRRTPARTRRSSGPTELSADAMGAGSAAVEVRRARFRLRRGLHGGRFTFNPSGTPDGGRPTAGQVTASPPRPGCPSPLLRRAGRGPAGRRRRLHAGAVPLRAVARRTMAWDPEPSAGRTSMTPNSASWRSTTGVSWWSPTWDRADARSGWLPRGVVECGRNCGRRDGRLRCGRSRATRSSYRAGQRAYLVAG